MEYEYIPVKEVIMEKNLWHTLTQMQYRSSSGETTFSSLINGMLKEYLHTYILSKTMGHMIIPNETVKIVVNGMTDEQIQEASAANAERYKEGAIIEHEQPLLTSYLELIKAFAKANNLDIEVSKNSDNKNQVLIIGFQMMGGNFSQFLVIPIGYYCKSLQTLTEWR